ncbi:MAG: hypothetical protein IT292_06285 [Deltaproteobacteria bacterium]|nr:hypothetical protein [Deltaproteobacteria bacterium]
MRSTRFWQHGHRLVSTNDQPYYFNLAAFPDKSRGNITGFQPAAIKRNIAFHWGFSNHSQFALSIAPHLPARPTRFFATFAKFNFLPWLISGKWVGTIVYLPFFALFTAVLLGRRHLQATEKFALALGIWTLTQCLAIGWARAGFSSPDYNPSPRYIDILCLGAVSNLLAVALLFFPKAVFVTSDKEGVLNYLKCYYFHCLKLLRLNTFALIWTAFLGAGISWYMLASINTIVPHMNAQRAYSQVVCDYIKSKDISLLMSKTFLYSNYNQLAEILNDTEIQKILPCR